jgi:hypothetical protein
VGVPNSYEGTDTLVLYVYDNARDNLRGQKSLGPLKISLEMAHKVIVPQKKIMSRSFLKGVRSNDNTSRRFDEKYEDLR